MPGVKIGCDQLHYALLIEDEQSELSFGTPVACPKVMSININPNASQETLFADDGPSESASTLGAIDVEIAKSALSTSEKAALLGHAIDESGGIVYGATDIPPWVAIGFRTLLSNGNYRYVWLYKGKFMEPEDSNETKGDNINFQNDTISGRFVRVNKEFKLGGKQVKPWKYEMTEDDLNATKPATEATMAAWFNEVVLPTEDTI